MLHVLLLLLLACVVVARPAQALEGVVLDGSSGQPIAQAVVVSGDEQQVADEAGHFSISAAAASASARAPGYRRRELPAQEGRRMVIELTPLRAKALYLSAYGIGNAELRGAALKLIDETELNALVIDLKGDRGIVPYRSAAMAAAGVKQPQILVADMPALLKTLRTHGTYLIARIVVFKDEPLVALHPAWAVHDPQGKIWKDPAGLSWIDPFCREAWEHSLAVAEEAAALGFDEVQFDYLRFPDVRGLVFSEANTEERRVAAIDDFLAAARRRLLRYNVFLSADIFGYVAWNRGDTQIGQQLDALAGRVDYLSPMLYPSGFGFGIPGYRDSMAAPYEIVRRTLERARQRTGLPGVRWRPWLQAFRDYAFDHRNFDADEIRAQIDAAEAEGADGWMLWNPRNRYDADGLAPSRPKLEGQAVGP